MFWNKGEKYQSKFKKGDIVVHKIQPDLKMIVLGYYLVGRDMPTCRYYCNINNFTIAQASSLLGATAIANNNVWREQEFNDYELELA